MSIKPDYFRYLNHIGESITLRELHDAPDRPHAVALRHDVDHDLDLALEMAHHEHARGIRATYFLLHSAGYWQDPQLADKCGQLGSRVRPRHPPMPATAATPSRSGSARPPARRCLSRTTPCRTSRR